jgi:hypothetical protein
MVMECMMSINVSRGNWLQVKFGGNSLGKGAD